MLRFLNIWANVIVAITGFLGVIMLGISALLIPWGLRLNKKDRHPFRKKPAVNNASNQSTASWQEWWGNNLKNLGWMLLSFSFLIQIFVGWP